MANSKRKCKACGERVRKYTVFNKMAFCSFESAVKWANKNQNIGAKKVKKENDKIFKERKNKLKDDDVSYQHKLTQKVFNKLRVFQEKKWFYDRGLVPKCISCGKKSDFCCGHFKSRGSQGNLRYDKKNSYLQCNRYCNMALSGNIEGNKNTRGYKKGLAKRFGEDVAKEIIDYCETNTQVRKWTGPELKKMRSQFNKEIKELANSV